MFTLQQISVRLMLCLAVVIAAESALQAQTGIPLDRQVGEVFVGIGNGQYQVWHPTPPTATLVETITQNFNSVPLTGANAGCAFDPTYHPFTTNVANNDVLRDGIEDPQNGIELINVAGAGGAQPTSIAFDGAGNSYVGNMGGNGLIEEYSPSGTLVQTLPVGTNKLKGGSAWIDLSADGKTIYFTNGSNTISQFPTSSSKIGKFASISSATLFALRVLPTPQGNGGSVLVAVVFSGSSNIQLMNASGTTVQTYSVAGENNFQVLALDPNGTSFWAGNPATRNFYRINLKTGNVEVSANTGATNGGPTGMCAYGAFSAGLYQPLMVRASYTSSSSAGCAVDALNPSLTNCTFSTVVPPPAVPQACAANNTVSNCFILTLNGINFGNAPNGLQLTYNYSQIAQAAGTSDTGLPCELSSPDGTKCEVHSVDVNPTNGSNDTNIYLGFDNEIDSVQPATNPVVLKNEVHELTDFIIHDLIRQGGSDTTKSIFTTNEQPVQTTGSHSCGYISPLLNSQYNLGRVIPFKFSAVTPPNTCPNGPVFLTNLRARLVLVQLTNLSNGNAAPHRVDFTLSDGTSCTESSPCFFRPGTQFILNVDTSGLQGGGTQYLGTTIDDSNQIPSFSTTAGGQTDIFTIN